MVARGRGGRISEFKASLVFRVSPRTASRTQRNLSQKARMGVCDQREIACYYYRRLNIQPFIPVSVVDFGYIEAIHSQDLSNKRLNEALINLPDSTPRKKKTHYSLSPEIREIASKLDSLKDSHIFQVFWQKTAESLSTLNQNPRQLKLLLSEACERLYHPCYEKFYRLYETLKSGEITFAEVDDIFRDFVDKYGELTIDLNCMCALDPHEQKGWIPERVAQIKEYHSLHQAVSSAKVILQVRSTLGVTGDFSVLDKLLNFVSCLLVLLRGEDQPGCS